MLWQYCRNKLALDANGDIDDFNAGNATTKSFNLKAKITGQTGNNGTKNVGIMVPLKYLRIFGELLKCLYLVVKLIFI